MLTLARTLRRAIHAEEQGAISAAYVELATHIGPEKATALAYRFWRTYLRRS